MGASTDDEAAADAWSGHAVVLQTAGFVAVGVLLKLVLHESLHVLVNALATGGVPDCGIVGPLVVAHGRIGVCYRPGGIPAWNNLLTPVAMSALGIAAFYWSPRFGTRPRRVAAFVVGVYAWFFEALYSMAYYIPPTLTETGVEYHGDGVVALDAFGHAAQLPGVVLLVVGLVALTRRVRYRGE